MTKKVELELLTLEKSSDTTVENKCIVKQIQIAPGQFGASVHLIKNKQPISTSATQKNEDFFKQLINNSTSVYLLINEDFIITYSNDY